MEEVPISFYLSFCEEQQVPLELHRAELFAVSSAPGAALTAQWSLRDCCHISH